MALPQTSKVPVLKTGLTAAAILGVIGAVGLFGSAAFWSVQTEISGAVIATGSVEVIGKPKSIQHLDGGIVEEIHIKDGQFVRQNDVLLRLDDTLLRSNLLIYKTRLSEALATRDRLVAEQQDAEKIVFEMNDPLIGDVDTGIYMRGQTEIFEARRELERGRMEQLREKIKQFENQTMGIEGLIAAKERQHVLLLDELNSMTKLMDQGLTLASQLLALQRNEADLLGQISEHHSELARVQNSVRDTEIEMLQGDRQLKEEAVTQLREVTTQIQELHQQIISTQKQLDRVAVKAPESGRIHELQITTLGGVVPPGGTMMQIVPKDKGLGFRMRVDPASIDQVFVGQPVALRFSAFNQRTTPELLGSVSEVSPTSVVDEASGLSFFWVSVEASPEELARLGDRELVPGMPVEAFLKTEDRTVLSYLTKPLTDQLQQAFREE